MGDEHMQPQPYPELVRHLGPLAVEDAVVLSMMTSQDRLASIEWALRVWGVSGFGGSLPTASDVEFELQRFRRVETASQEPDQALFAAWCAQHEIAGPSPPGSPPDRDQRPDGTVH